MKFFNKKTCDYELNTSRLKTKDPQLKDTDRLMVVPFSFSCFCLCFPCLTPSLGLDDTMKISALVGGWKISEAFPKMFFHIFRQRGWKNKYYGMKYERLWAQTGEKKKKRENTNKKEMTGHHTVQLFPLLKIRKKNNMRQNQQENSFQETIEKP